MASYEWICRECNIYWEREYGLGKAPDRTRCPACKILSNRFWQNSNIGVSFCDDKDFHTVRQRYKKHAQMGFDQDAGNKFLNRSIEKVKDNLNDESYRYKSANIEWDKFAESRGAEKVSSSKAEQKLKTAEKLTADAYDRANKMGYKDAGATKLDISKPLKNS